MNPPSVTIRAPCDRMEVTDVVTYGGKTAV